MLQTLSGWHLRGPAESPHVCTVQGRGVRLLRLLLGRPATSSIASVSAAAITAATATTTHATTIATTTATSISTAKPAVATTA